MSQGISREHYTVGWVCALHKEMVAATAMLDEVHPTPSQPLHDSNNYRLGRIGHHNVVIACLPLGVIGNNSSAAVATRLTSTFPRVRVGLMVGIGGGVPTTVRLGDVVVSAPADGHGGVVQWDFGKTEQGHTFRRVGSLDSPPTIFKTALAALKVKHEMEGSQIQEFLGTMEKKWPRLVPKYTRCDGLRDTLFPSDYHHIETEVEGQNGLQSCRRCDYKKAIKRRPRDMKVHYGLIASGNQVIKDGEFRDEINARLGGRVLCFEMEAAGLMNDFPCIAIRGICDYSDSHKDKAWQEYAAAVAAATAKEILLLVPEQQLVTVPPMANALDMSSMKYVLHDLADSADYERARGKDGPTTGDDTDGHDDQDDYDDDQNDQDNDSDDSLDDEPVYQSVHDPVVGESYTKYHATKFTLAITGTKYLFGGPRYQVWRMKKHLGFDYKYDEMPRIWFGTNGSWYRHYHAGKKCWTKRSRNFKDEYPGLFEKLKKNKATSACPTTVALGIGGDYFFDSDERTCWKLPKTVTKVCSPTTMKKLWLGKDGTFVLVKQSGSIKFNLKGCYDGLGDFLSDLIARERSIKALALGVDVDRYVIVGGDRTKANLPDEFWGSYEMFSDEHGLTLSS